MLLNIFILLISDQCCISKVISIIKKLVNLHILLKVNQNFIL